MSIFNVISTEYEGKIVYCNVFNHTLLKGTKSTSKDLLTFKEKSTPLYEDFCKEYGGNGGKKDKPTPKKTAVFSFVLLHLLDFILENRTTSRKRTLVKNEESGKFKFVWKSFESLKNLPTFLFPQDDFINDSGKLDDRHTGYQAFVFADLSILFSFHKGGKEEEREVFYYQNTCFRKGSLQDVIRLLGKAHILPSREGHNFKNESRQCLLFLNYPKCQRLIEFYEANKNLIDRLREKIESSKAEIRRKPEALIVIKEEIPEGKNKVLREVEDISVFRKRKEFKDSIEYLRRLIGMYEGISISLQSPKEATEAKLSECREEIEFKNKVRAETGKEIEPFDVEQFEREVQKRNKQLGKKKYPYRLFHLVDNKLLWGRIYSNLGVNELPREYGKLVLIDGKESCQIDLSSASVQLFYTLYVNKDKYLKPKDFYEFKSLEYSPHFVNSYGEFDAEYRREKIKYIFQVALNSANDQKAFLGFGNHYNFNIKKKTFLSIIQTMYEERPWLKKYFFKENLGKKLILAESNFFIKAGIKLMDAGLKFVHHMDSLYVVKDKVEHVLKILKQVGRDEFNAELDFKIK